jgi:hypothetical protein|tara:strand:- start:663 stop:875 length:213 start_codon:yes stop_codon:yes gene_type:complete
MANNEEMITIDDVDYKLSELSEGCQAEIRSLQFTEEQIIRLNAEVAIAETARNAYRLAVSEKLPNKDPKH